MSRIIDADTHFLEPDSFYLDHVEPRERDLALRVERDARGWPWLVHRGRRLHPIDAHVPGRPEAIGAQRRRRQAGERCTEPETAVPDGCDPEARIRMLEANGVDASIVFPNLGLGFRHALRNDLPSLSANMAAWNRWLLEIAPACAGRLYPVAQLHLHDLDWFEREIRRCARGGLKLAMVGAEPAGGRSLAHPDLDRAWAAFQDCDMSACFHVSQVKPPLDPAWYALDPNPSNKLLDMTFLYLAPAVAVASLIAHGKLEQFPGLRIGVTELSAGWVPGFLLHLDGAFRFYDSQNGAPLARLPLRPSEYFRRQVKVNAFPLEGAAQLMALAGEQIFTWGSDYPHAEGMERPCFEAYLKVQPRELDAVGRAALGGGNASFLIGESASSEPRR